MKMEIPVSEIMNTNLIVLPEISPVNEMLDLFKNRGVHHVLVENENSEFVGIVSTEDVLEYKYYMFESQVNLKNIMTKDPITRSPETPLDEIIDVFQKERFRAIPILDHSKELVGIVTPYDVLAYISK